VQELQPLQLCVGTLYSFVYCDLRLIFFDVNVCCQIGRLVLAAWKLVAEEVKHPNASFQPAVAFSVLGQRVPFHDNIKLTEWYGHGSGRERWRVIHHQFVKAATSLRLFDALDMIGRAGEAARLSGVELFHSFPGIRGSQYKVEGVLLRALQSLNSEDRGSKRGRMASSTLSGGGVSSLSSDSASQTQSPWKVRRGAHNSSQEDSENSQESLGRGYFFYSPSNQDTDNQEALTVQALTLEPESGHHQDPVVVCDFTALYPSLIIAYTTVFGHLEYHSTRREMCLSGRTTGKVGPFLYPEGRTSTVLNLHMKSLRQGGIDRAYVSPTGTLYVAESVLKGVLPQVLDEMLCTRAMLKKAAKQYQKLVPDLAPSILRQLEARQLALKYVANVTYGTLVPLDPLRFA
jgi:DNA polymerase family B